MLNICKTIIESLDCNGCKNPKDIAGTTPLHLAAKYGRVGVFELILKLVNDKKPKDNQGMTPIELADGHKNIIRIFERFS